jgi:hypothetical protein
MTTSLTPTQQAIEIGYNLASEDLVRQFLDENYFLAPLLKMISDNTLLYFTDRKLSLEVISDPEIPNYEKLLISISSSYDLPEAMRRLRMFDEGWWLEYPPLAQDKILIDIR